MEAAIRFAYKFYTGHEIKNYEVLDVSGIKNGIKLATVDFDGNPVHLAVAQGIANAMKLIKKIKNHDDDDVKDVRFVEVMACPGGCGCGGFLNCSFSLIFFLSFYIFCLTFKSF